MSDTMIKLYQERKKRYLTAMDLGKPDMVPIRIFLAEFAAKYAGCTLQELYYQMEINVDCAEKIIKEFDMDAYAGPPSVWWAGIHDAAGAKYLKFSGKELPENTQFQYVEGEYMHVEDYDAFIDNPTEWIMNTYLLRLHNELAEPGSYRANLSLIKGAQGFLTQINIIQQAWAKWAEEFGALPFTTGMTKAPFDTLGDTLRGLTGVMTDIRRHPEKIKKAMDVLVDHNIYYGMATAAGDTELPLFMPLHRGSYPFLNPKQWNEFYWPTLKKVIEGLWAKGKRTLFYAEGNWTPYLEKIAELPEKSIVFHADKTDLDKAKNILGKKFCLSGNIANTLLAFGTPEQVKESVRRLLDKYASGGGFILDSAAVVQTDARAENISAMIEAGREYGVY